MTLLDVLSKLFTKILNNRLSRWAESNGIYAEGQSGFRDGYSTADGVFLLHAVVDHWMTNPNNKVYCAMVDFRKAFEYIVYDNLWRRMIEKGVTGKTLSIHVVKFMYRQLKNRIRGFTGDLSEPFQGAIGLRQGESLSPFLFSLIVNDIEADLRRSGSAGCIKWGHLAIAVLLYADDLYVLASTPRDLQASLDCLDGFCADWNLTVNCQKTEILVFENDPPATQPVFTYRGTPLPHTGKFKYLGISFSKTGDWSSCIETLCGQARKAKMALRQRFYSYEFTACEKYRLFLRLVEPILSYGSEVWGYQKANEMELLHRRFMREILSVRNKTKNELLYSELGMIPLRPLRLMKMVNFWAGVANPNSNKLSSQIYRLQRTGTRVSWCTHVRDALIEYDFGDMWLGGPPIQGSALQNAYKAKVWQVEQRKILDGLLTGTGRARFYQHLANLSPSRLISPWYFDNIDRSNMRVLTRFRLRSTNLGVVTGAWIGKPLNERLCDTCMVVDDEVHHLCECRRLEHLRGKYLPEEARLSRSAQTAITIMNSKDAKTVNNLCIFLKKAAKVMETPVRRMQAVGVPPSPHTVAV